MRSWHVAACEQLDEQLLRMREPPQLDEVHDLRIALEHAEEELRLTELSASFPAGVTVVLLRHARRLSGFLHWLHTCCSPEADELRYVADKQGMATAPRHDFLRGEAQEFRRRAMLLARTVFELRSRLPDPELPVRWAEWFEERGEIAGLPRSHCARYRSQREQVAAVWANNRRTFLSTEEHIEALVQCLDELDEMVGECTSSKDEGKTEIGQAAAGGLHCPALLGGGDRVDSSCSAITACAAGLVYTWRRLWRSLRLASAAC